MPMTPPATLSVSASIRNWLRMSPRRAPDRHADADFAGALRDRDQHDVHDADAADDQRDRRDADQQHRQRLGRLLRRLHELRRAAHREVGGSAVGDMVALLEQRRDFLLHRVHVVGRVHLHLNLPDKLGVVQPLLRRAEGNVDHVILVAAARRALRLQHANHLIALSVDNHRLAQRIGATGGEQVLHHRLAEHGDRLAFDSSPALNHAPSAICQLPMAWKLG